MRPVITPVMIQRFAEYLEVYPTWGALHVVMDDENWETKHVRGCVYSAQQWDDAEGLALAEILLTLTGSQRCKLERKARAVCEARRKMERRVQS